MHKPTTIAECFLLITILLIFYLFAKYIIFYVPAEKKRQRKEDKKLKEFFESKGIYDYEN